MAVRRTPVVVTPAQRDAETRLRTIEQLLNAQGIETNGDIAAIEAAIDAIEAMLSGGDASTFFRGDQTFDSGLVNASGAVSFYLEAYGGAANNMAYRANGTQGSESALALDDQITALSAAGWNGSGFTNARGRIRVLAAGAWTGASTPTKIRVETTASGSTTLTARWEWSDAGHFLPFASNTYDIGSSSLLVRAIYAATQSPLTSNNTVATTEYVDDAVAAGGGSGGGDPFIGNLASLLHLNGTNGSTTITDVRGKTWTANGNAQISTAQSVFGGASLLLDGTGDYISASHVDLSLQNNDFTVEMRFRIAGGIGSAQGLFFNGDTTSNNNRIQFGVNTSTVLTMSIATTAATTSITGTTVLSADTWYAVSIIRRGSNIAIFLNGVIEASGTFSGTQTAINTTYVGFDRAGGVLQYFNGYIDECRISKGVCRYAVTYDIPSTEFPNT